MEEPNKPSVYRQLYHAANGLESRFTRPSMVGNNQTLPLVSGRVITAAIGLGFLLWGVVEMFKPDKENEDGEEKDLEDAEKEKEELEAEVKDAERNPPDEYPQQKESERGAKQEARSPASQVKPPKDSRNWWDKLVEATGLKRRPSGEEENTDTPEVGKPTPVEPSSSSPMTKTDPSVVYLARESKLGPKATLSRDRYKSHELFTGKYKRLARAHLTAPELQWALKLIQVGAPITGRFGKPIIPLVRSLILQRAEAHGLDPEAMLKMASMESGADPNAVSGTGAIGVYQFTSSTANKFGLKNRFDLDAGVEAGMLLAKSNIRFMKGSNGPLQVYIAHQIGGPAAKVVFNSPRSKRIRDLPGYVRKNISHNVGKNARTVGEYLDANAKKMEETYQQQVKAGSFKGSVNIKITSNEGEPAPTRVSSLDIPAHNEPSPTAVTAPVTGLPVPSTAVAESSTAPAVPDQSYSHKASLRGEDSLVVASAGDDSEHTSKPALITTVAGSTADNRPIISSVFRLNGNGLLVIT